MPNPLPTVDVVRQPVAELNGLPLNWPVAVYDPRSVGLAFRVVNGVLCGVSAEPDGSTLICTYLHGTGRLASVNARRKLGLDVGLAESYCPTDHWPHAGHLIEVGRIEVGPDGDTLWRAKAGDIELRG